MTEKSKCLLISQNRVLLQGVINGESGAKLWSVMKIGHIHYIE